MKVFFVTSLCFFSILTASVAQVAKEADLSALPSHPRILLLKDEEKVIRAAISRDEIWKKMHMAIIDESERMIALPLLERIQIGRRLLDKSRECLRRVFYLSYAYRMTGDEKYLSRAEKEMLTVAKFSDWNPTHFLDVAEMTMGMAIGYDWLHDKLSDASRTAIAEAILYRGLLPSFDGRYNSWLRANHNWNQVCNAGMTFGALAVADRYPGITQQIIERALSSIHLPMEDYGPDGAYPEGYIYWDYGTSFNVMFLSAIAKAVSTDYGLTQIPGFLKTAGFYQNMTGVTGQPFNWGDCGSRASLSPAMFWFAQKNNDPTQLWVEKGYLTRDDFSSFTSDRLLPAIMVWGKDTKLDEVKPPYSKFWMGQGANPVCMMRTSWTDPRGLYLGFKAGSASVNHGHMDIGSFVFESDGVRWAMDFGMQQYESLESKGIRLFGRTQDAQRWSVFRKKMKITFPFNVHRLGISHHFFRHFVKIADIVWPRTAVLEALATCTSSAHKDPYVAGVINQQAGIVVRIIHSQFVVYDHRLRNCFSFVIKTADHAQQMFILFACSTPVHEKCLVHFRRIDGEWHVMRCVSSQPSGILVAILGELAKREPDTFVTIHRLIIARWSLSRAACYEKNSCNGCSQQFPHRKEIRYTRACQTAFAITSMC